MILNDIRVVRSKGHGMYPEQHWGELTDGSVFYFRMRHGWAQLHVGPPGTPLDDLPLVNPRWDYHEREAAVAAGEHYIHFYWYGPVGVDEVYPDDDMMGHFRSQSERDASFSRCLDQIWQKGRIPHE